MIVKVTTAETNQATSKDVGYNISTGQYQSSAGFIEANHEVTEYICSKTIPRHICNFRSLFYYIYISVTS